MPNRRKNRPDHDLDALDAAEAPYEEISFAVDEPSAAREAGSGLATGRRQFEPIRDPIGDTDGDSPGSGTDADGVFHNITWTEEFSADAPSLVNNEVIEGVFKFGVAPKPGNVEDLLGAGGAGDEAGTLKYGDITLRSLGRENSIEVLYATADEPDGFVFNKELDKSTPLLGIDDTPAESDPTYDTDDAGE